MPGNASKDHLQLSGTKIHYPAYLPDATYGMVRALDARDLEECRVQALMMNSFHLIQRPGSMTVQSLGGLHNMSAWSSPIFTDSGGFQAYSLIRQDPKFGSIQDRGLSFQPENAKRKFLLTPEKSVQVQVSYDTNVVICLDDCTHVDASSPEQKNAVLRTIDWARRSKKEYQRIGDQKGWTEETRPLLFAVIQGGGEHDLRRQCADALLEIGFDGFGFGGWPLDAEGSLLEDILTFTRELVPKSLPMHALGVGHPVNIAACVRMGYELFDSAMPTRDARHGRLYTFDRSPDEIDFTASGKWLHYLYIHDKRHMRTSDPLSPYCSCHTCRSYSSGYLRHLFKTNDCLYQRLATIHNLFFMSQLMQRLRIQYYGG